MKAKQFNDFLDDIKSGKMPNLVGVGFSEDQSDLVCTLLDRKIKSISKYKENAIMTRVVKDHIDQDIRKLGLIPDIQTDNINSVSNGNKDYTLPELMIIEEWLDNEMNYIKNSPAFKNGNRNLISTHVKCGLLSMSVRDEIWDKLSETEEFKSEVDSNIIDHIIKHMDIAMEQHKNKTKKR